MKEKGDKIDYIRKVVYSKDAQGTMHGTAAPVSDVEKVIMEQVWDAELEKQAEILVRVKQGLVSPIAYFMHKNVMDLALLAKYMGKWQWQVKRHFKPEVFSKLPEKTLARYAEVFNISLHDLKNFAKQ